MSSLSYCQGLQSCLEPSRLVEARVLRLKLAPSKSKVPNCSPNPEEESDLKSQVIDMGGGWSFLQSLATNNTTTSHSQSQPTYTPPSIKRSPSFLCEKSLEMCTERLGSETGSEVSEGGEEGGGNEEMAAFLPLENGGCYNRNNNEETCKEIGSSLVGNKIRKLRRTASFPPPLTSIIGSTGVQVKPHREGGRLVLKAVSVSSCKGYFHAERSNGRLTLRLMKKVLEEEEEEEEKEEEEVEEQEEEEASADEVEDEDSWGEELEGINGNVGEERGLVEKLATRPISRCNEGGSGNKGLNNWKKPPLVAT